MHETNNESGSGNVSNNKLARLRIKARKELKEFEEEIPKCIEKLRKLLKALLISEEEPTLILPEDDSFLLRFLRARKFDISRTKSLVKNYYDMRFKNEELFRDLCPESVIHVLDEGIQCVLDKRDSEGRQMFIFRAGKWNPDIINLDEIFRTNYLCLEEMTATDETQICGIIAVVDFEGMGFYQARQFTPKHAIRMVQIIQNSFPCRFQEFHLINQPYLFNFLYAVVKPFLNEKIKRRIYFHGHDLDALHSKIDPAILPDFLGGIASSDTSTFRRNLTRKNHLYREMLQYGYHPKKVEESE